MRSLRVRLLLATALVAGVAVATLALFSRHVVTREFQRFVHSDRPATLEPVAAALAADAAARGSLAGAGAVLARLAPGTGHALALVDSGHRVVAASSAPLVGLVVGEGPGGLVTLAREDEAGAGGAVRLELVNPSRRAVVAADGRPLGMLMALPGPGPTGEAGAPFLRTVNRGLWAGVAAAIAAGLAVVWLIAGRIVGPIESLTAAARRMERGDLTPRVAARGADEVATLSRSFNAMAESLAAAETRRRQLTRDVAHELRTPLTNLRAQIEALEDGLATPDAATLGSLRDEVLLLSGLVDDLQQLADAESGSLRLDLAAVPARAALESAAAAFAARAAGHGVALRVADGSEAHVRADPQRLAQILQNLLANAVAHTPRGGAVTLAARREGDRVAFAVADTGEGIAAEHLPHVFERFYRADPARSRATGGAGLGLAIVRHLVERQGGEVAAASEPGAGTRITFTLPAADAGAGGTSGARPS